MISMLMTFLTRKSKAPQLMQGLFQSVHYLRNFHVSIIAIKIRFTTWARNFKRTHVVKSICNQCLVWMMKADKILYLCVLDQYRDRQHRPGKSMHWRAKTVSKPDVVDLRKNSAQWNKPNFIGLPRSLASSFISISGSSPPLAFKWRRNRLFRFSRFFWSTQLVSR